jgi:hypothetical protein
MLQLPAFVLVIAAGCAAEPAATKADVSDAEIEKLVAQLASPNRAPELDRPFVVKYDPNYDREAQKKVSEAWMKLRALAPRSFPFVFDHLADNRYALTEDAGDFEENYSVGFLCRDILVSHLQPDTWGHKEFGTSFKRRPNQPDYVEHFGLLDPRSARQWWKTRKDLSLRDLQIEVLQWVLKEEERLTETYTDEDRASVKKELAELRASREPRRPGFPFAK